MRSIEHAGDTCASLPPRAPPLPLCSLFVRKVHRNEILNGLQILYRDLITPGPREVEQGVLKTRNRRFTRRTVSQTCHEDRIGGETAKVIENT